MFMGSIVGSEVTAAALDLKAGTIRRSFRDASVLRISHGRLLPALDQHGPEIESINCLEFSMLTGSANHQMENGCGQLWR